MAEQVTTTAAGRVRGEDIDGGVVFRGIPFAAPPVGERRHQPPAPAEKWDGIRDCQAFGPICPQVQLGELGGVLAALGSNEPTDEDCLYVNVWTPAADDARRPTMVWIHGGAFTAGSGSSAIYDGRAFVRDDVVLVTVNYRLHALGFLYLDELFDGAEGTGNLGILDQVAALEWVRDNIAAFGGDPDNVTIFGESAGGMSVGTLLGTPRAEGLFRRAIAMSGAGHNNLSTAAATRVTRRVLERLEVRPGDWDALRALPANRVVKIANQVGQFEGRALLDDESRTLMAYQPVVDGVVRPKRAIQMVQDGSAAGVDLMIGTCAEEWRLFIWGLPKEYQDLLPEADIAPYFANAGRTPEEVLKVYGSTRPDAGRKDLLAAVETDQMFTLPAIRLAEAQLGHHDNVRMYRFSWRTPVLDGSLGACHALELPFLFEMLDHSGDFVGSSPPADLADDIHRAWVSFAATGDPGSLSGRDWPTYDTDRRPVMDFSATRQVVNDPNSEERQLWEGLV
jgi:para-nitrobenzyl esterase